MNKMFRGISAVFLSAVLLAMSAVTAFAATSAKTGESIELKVSIEGESCMGSTTVQIDYDKNMLDFLSDETLEGTGLSNPNEPGQILWAAMFGSKGADYTNKTDVYSVTFVAKQDIPDVDSIIKFQVNDAYRISDAGVEPANPSCLSCSVALEGGSGNNAVESKADDNSPNDNGQANTQNNSQTTSKDNNSSSSKADSNGSSSLSSKTDTKSNPADESSDISKTESIATDKSTDKAANTEIEENTESLVERSDETESVPSIKLSSDSASSTADSESSFPVGVIIGIVVFLIIAAAGIVVIISKKKK